MYDYKLVEISKLKKYPKNARLHSTEQVKQIMESIKEFGFTNPLLIDSDFNIIAGHGRLEAILQLNKLEKASEPFEKLPCIIISGLNETQKKALVIADNKIAENATWDFELLQMELMELESSNFDLELLGFNENELVEIMGESSNDFDSTDDFIAEPQTEAKIIKRGDLIELGKHRVLCGDSTIEADVNKLIGGGAVDIVFTSPPYNAGVISGYWYGQKTESTTLYQDKNIDNKSKSEYFDFCIKILENISRVVNEKHLILWNVAYNNNSRDDFGKIIFSEKNPFLVLDTLVWKKTISLPFKSKKILSRRCEFVFSMAKDIEAYLAYFSGGEHNLIETKQEKALMEIHRACFSLDFVNKTLEKFNLKNGLKFYEPFCGSGTTLIYCEKTNNVCFGMEIEPIYCEVIINRYCKEVGSNKIKINGEVIEWEM